LKNELSLLEEQMKKKFDYNEVVTVSSPRPEFIHLKNYAGYIAGDAYDENEKKWFYGVFIFKEGIVYSIGEEEITSTGTYYNED
jgi:hypothetical protein